MADSTIRVKQSTSASFKAHCDTEKGKKEINAFLNGLLKIKERFDEHKKSWCWWLLAGGKTPEEFKSTVKSFDHPTICGLVWNKNFVAYRCRDCGISPCMSICADCFHAGNHEGHDFNMFKSQAGGACDCGDESVMAKKGFCSRHGKETNDVPQRKPPDELFSMARIVIPQLCMRLYVQLDQVDKDALGSSSEVMIDANELAEFLMSICETDTVKNVVAECLLMKISEIEAIIKDKKCVASSSATFTRRFHLPSRTSHSEIVELRDDSLSMDCDFDNLSEDDSKTYLDCMMDFVTKLEFPQKIVTFLLHLLPCKQYKESFTRVFCQNYQKIARTLVSTTDTGPSVEQLASRVVHVSVQLYSNKHLAEKMVREQNFLQVMVRVLHDMIKPSLKPFKRGQELSPQLVVNCDNRALKDHCYWPIVTDFINVLSHRTIAETFMNDLDLIQQWIKFIQYLTGMNISQRQLLTHIEYESTIYCTSFSVELEAASSPLWSMIHACTVLNSETCVRNVISNVIDALESWYRHSSAIMPRRGEVTLHLSLHRYLSGFLSLAMSHFNMSIKVPQTLLAQMVQHLLQIQAAVCEIRAGRWVRNGNQIRSQVRLYVECHFCNSMVDLDIFMLQICAANLDPDDFLDAILERFGIKHWFEFGPLAVPTPTCFDSDTDVAMVKGALNLILTLLSSRLYLGLSNQEVIRQEMVTQLCIGDKTHSQLVELIPDKPGQSHKIQDFEKTLNELADYKAPGFESGWMQQGKYTPKGNVWENEFDPVHVFHRVVQRPDIQSAMSRYSSFVNKNSQNSSTLWPPFKSLKPLPNSCEGVLRLLNCKTMHGMLFYIFHQASMDSSSIPDAVLYLAVHLTSLALENTTSLPIPMVIQNKDVEDVGCQIAMRCIDHLELYGKHVKGLHQTEDLRHVNAGLVTKLQQDPAAVIDPQHFSCHEVCVVMACAVHQIMQPPLFDPFLPFMARVLNSALTNRSNTHEKVAQLQYIQYLLELLPAHRQRLVKKLTRHLVSVSERYKIPTKNLVLVSDDTQPMELSMLLMYLIKYHDWLFRVHTPNPGWPHDIGDLDFKSISMVENIRHTVGIVTGASEPMDTSDKGKAGSSTSQSSSSTILGPLNEGGDESTAFQNLVQQFMAITEAPETVARSLLYTCKGNLEVALNMHLNMEDTIPDVIPNPGAQSSSTTGEGSRESSAASEPVQPTAINENILSLLLKVKAGCQSSSSFSSSSFGTCIYYINKLLDQAGRCSSYNHSVLSAIDSSVVTEDAKAAGDDADDSAAKTSLRRQRARERQQKLLAEFASKQKSFMEQALKSDPDALDTSMEVDTKPSVTEVQAISYECVICGESSPSTEERPVGLVALLQPSAVLKHRSLRTRQTSASEQPAPLLQCGNFTRSRMNAFMKLFNKDDSLDASAAGCESGIHVQTCGHYLHVDCQQSYLRSLQEEEAAQLHQMHSFNPRNGDFTCPLCRQLGNCVMPEVPSRLTAPKENLRSISYSECLNLHEEVMRKYRQNSMTRLTKSALNFSVLGASIKTVIEIASMLDDSCDEIKSDRLFALMYRTLRTNLELEQVDKEARKLSAARKSCFGSIFRAFQFHCQTLVGPMIDVWSELTNMELPQNPSKSAKATNVPVLLREGPSLLIQMMLSWPTTISLQDFQCLVQVIYNLVFTQALVHSCCKFVGDERLSWQETGKKALIYEKTQKPLTVDMLLGFVTLTLSSSNLFKEDNQVLGISQSVWSPHMVEQSIRDFCLPYLKHSSLISALCFDTKLPTVEANDQEFQAYAASLQLYSESATPREAFSCANCLRWQQNERPLTIIRKWCDSLSYVTRRYELFDKSQDLMPVTYQWPPPSLIELPERYDTLIQHYRKQKCTKCDTKPDEPAICLVCGKFVCLQGTCCMSNHGDVRRYECVQHAVECGAGTCVFLIILSSVIIIIRADRVCIWGSVYLDSFGEEDRDLRRGKPLFLSVDRFKRLKEQWFTHSFDHTCKRWKRHLSTL